jgi:hypothetical protein
VVRADRIKLGTIVDLGTELEPAEVVDLETNAEAIAALMGLDVETASNRVALRLRQEGKQRGAWVAIPLDRGVKTLRR